MISPNSLIRTVLSLYGFGDRAGLARQRPAPVLIGHANRRIG